MFNAVGYKNKKLLFFTIGYLHRYMRHGMAGDVLLGEMKHPLSKDSETSILYRFEFDEESLKNFGRTAHFTSHQKYTIIKPLFTHDLWGNREKLFDLDTKEIVDIKMPRGFSKHHIFDANDICFLSLGKNSKKENIISILKEEA